MMDQICNFREISKNLFVRVAKEIVAAFMQSGKNIITVLKT